MRAGTGEHSSNAVAFHLRLTASASIAAGRVKEYRFRNPDLATSVLGFVYEIQIDAFNNFHSVAADYYRRCAAASCRAGR